VRQPIDAEELTTVWGNSPGGDVTAALAIYDTLAGRDVMIIATRQCEIVNNPSAHGSFKRTSQPARYC
jgi:hypothetical protein